MSLSLPLCALVTGMRYAGRRAMTQLTNGTQPSRPNTQNAMGALPSFKPKESCEEANQCLTILSLEVGCVACRVAIFSVLTALAGHM